MTIRESFVCTLCHQETSVELNDNEESRTVCMACTPDTSTAIACDELFDPGRPLPKQSGIQFV